MFQQRSWIAMWSVLILSITAAALLGPRQTVEAQGVGKDSVTDAYAFESVAVSTAAVRLAASNVAPSGQGNAKEAYCTVFSNTINIRFDGTDPTNAIGHTYAAGASFSLWGINNIRRLRAIRVSADATMQCTLSR